MTQSVSCALLSAAPPLQNAESPEEAGVEQCDPDKKEQLSLRDIVDLQETGCTVRIQPPGTESLELQVLSSVPLKILPCIFTSLWFPLFSALRCQARCWWPSCTRCWWTTRSRAIAHVSLCSCMEAPRWTTSPSCAASRAFRAERSSSWWRVTASVYSVLIISWIILEVHISINYKFDRCWANSQNGEIQKSQLFWLEYKSVH